MTVSLQNRKVQSKSFNVYCHNVSSNATQNTEPVCVVFHEPEITNIVKWIQH